MDAHRGRAELGVAVTGNVISDSVAEFRQEKADKAAATSETGKAARRRRKKEKLRAAQTPTLAAVYDRTNAATGGELERLGGHTDSFAAHAFRSANVAASVS
jgi:hypothetical protein